MSDAKISSELVSALFYGINKGIGDVLGEGGAVLGRRASMSIVEFLKEKGMVKENMSNEEIRKLFVEEFGLAEDVQILEEDKKVTFKIVKPTLVDFLKAIMEKGLTPYVCPFVGVLALIYSESKGVKLMMNDVVPKGDEVDLIFKVLG